MQKIALTIATFFGCGLSPMAPGTLGSLASFVIWAPLLYFDVSWIIRFFILVFLLAVGIWASSVAVTYYHNPDPPQVVIDEVVGQGIPLLFASFYWPTLLLAFVLFRLFDIWKPWPIKRIERSLPHGYGVMLDDVMAGLYALFICWMFGALWSW